MSALSLRGAADSELEAVSSCLREGWLTMGPRTRQFEQALAAYLGAEQAVATSSGLGALHLALLASGVGPADEVIVPAFGTPAAVRAVRLVGASAVPADICSPARAQLDHSDLALRLTPRTRAVIVGHHAGYAAPVEATLALCRPLGIAVIEDAGQALGARAGDGLPVGGHGRLTCFSLASGHQLDVGEGGVVVAEEPALADRIRLLRSHGMTSGTWERHRGHAAGYDVVEIGFNYRLDEPRASLGLVRLGGLEEELERRRAAARQLSERLAGIDGVTQGFDSVERQRGANFALALLLRDRGARERVWARLQRAGVDTIRYPAACKSRSASARKRTPRAEQASRRQVAIALGPSQRPLPELLDTVSRILAEEARVSQGGILVEEPGE